MNKYTDHELLYAATARCKCGAGLAYPIKTDDALKINAWVCSEVLKGQAPIGHQAFPFAFYKIREETSINNRGGYTTRPIGTRCFTRGHAICPKCGHHWESVPYSACGSSHHWFSGPCPNCAYAVGGGSSYSSIDGTPIDVRFTDVVMSTGG